MTAGAALLYVLGFFSGWCLATGRANRRLARARVVLEELRREFDSLRRDYAALIAGGR